MSQTSEEAHCIIPYEHWYSLDCDSSLFINTALILWAFNISEDPAQRIDTMAFTDTANVRVHPFKAVYEPRVPRLQEVVETYLD